MDDDCQTIIQEAWNAGGNSGILEKLAATNVSFNSWSKVKFSKAMRDTDQLKEQIDILQAKARSEIENKELISLKKKLETLWRMEELHWFQRARANWILYGDKNTKFFHATTIYNRRHNRILRLLNYQGEWVESDKGLEKHINSFFQNLFKADPDLDFPEAIEAVNPIIDREMKARLDRPITIQELKAAAFGMGAFKAPGLDGFQGIFYHTFWSIISNDLFTLVSNFFCNGFLPEELNQTNIVLIPKITAPESIGQFRPIIL